MHNTKIHHPPGSEHKTPVGADPQVVNPGVVKKRVVLGGTTFSQPGGEFLCNAPQKDQGDFEV